MKIPVVLSSILWAAIEDFHGLWEYPGEVQGAMGISGSLRAAFRPIASAAIVTCLTDELIQLFWCEEPYGEMSVISGEEAIGVLDEDAWWQVPRGQTRAIRVGSTPFGEEIYQRLRAEIHEAPIRPLR